MPGRGDYCNFGYEFFFMTSYKNNRVKFDTRNWLLTRP